MAVEKCNVFPVEFPDYFFFFGCQLRGALFAFPVKPDRIFQTGARKKFMERSNLLVGVVLGISAIIAAAVFGTFLYESRKARDTR